MVVLFGERNVNFRREGEYIHSLAHKQKGWPSVSNRVTKCPPPYCPAAFTHTHGLVYGKLQIVNLEIEVPLLLLFAQLLGPDRRHITNRIVGPL